MGDADILGLAAIEGGAAEEAAFFAAGGEAVTAVEALRAVVTGVNRPAE